MIAVITSHLTSSIPLSLSSCNFLSRNSRKAPFAHGTLVVIHEWVRMTRVDLFPEKVPLDCNSYWNSKCYRHQQCDPIHFWSWYRCCGGYRWPHIMYALVLSPSRCVPRRRQRIFSPAVVGLSTPLSYIIFALNLVLVLPARGAWPHENTESTHAQSNLTVIWALSQQFWGPTSNKSRTRARTL